MGAAGGRDLGQGDAADARRPAQRSAHPQLLRQRDAGQPPIGRGRTACPACTSCRTSVLVSGTWQYQAGAPEETTVVVTNQTISLPQGNTDAARGASIGDTRLPKVAGLDLSFRRTFRFGSSTIAPRLDIFNATNEATVTARITQLGPSYERISGIQRGRLIKLGVNLEF